MSPKFPRKFNGLYKQINIYLWHTKMEYDNFQTIRIEKEKKNHPSLSDFTLSYRNSPYVEQSTD